MMMQLVAGLFLLQADPVHEYRSIDFNAGPVARSIAALDAATLEEERGRMEVRFHWREGDQEVFRPGRGLVTVKDWSKLRPAEVRRIYRGDEGAAVVTAIGGGVRVDIFVAYAPPYAFAKFDPAPNRGARFIGPGAIERVTFRAMDLARAWYAEEIAARSVSGS